MIHRDDPGPQEWNGVHVTHRTTVAALFDVDNVGPDGALLTGFERTTGREEYPQSPRTRMNVVLLKDP